MGTTYEVKRGDTLSGIAQEHNLRYWPNIYYAVENNAFRKKRSNPNIIQPKDKIHIPSTDEVSVLERKPNVSYGNVKLFSQRKLNTCWRASAKMLWMWGRNRTEKQFFDKIGSTFASKTTALSPSQLSDFYEKKLGLKIWYNTSAPNEVNINGLHNLIAEYGPTVIALQTGGAIDHAVILAGRNIPRRRWYIIDPFDGMAEDMWGASITVNTLKPSQQIAKTFAGAEKRGMFSLKTVHDNIWPFYITHPTPIGT